jgi:hypothetical protein
MSFSWLSTISTRQAGRHGFCSGTSPEPAAIVRDRVVTSHTPSPSLSPCISLAASDVFRHVPDESSTERRRGRRSWISPVRIGNRRSRRSLEPFLLIGRDGGVDEAD